MLKCQENELIKQEDYDMGQILLINDKPLYLIPKLAVMVGINEALILQMLHEGVNDSPIKADGHTWYQHPYENWANQFPFLSLATIKRAILKLEKLNYILTTTKFNDIFDRRKWYCINYDLLYHDLGVQFDTSTISRETTERDQMNPHDGV